MQRQVGTANQIIQVVISSASTGLPITGLVYNSSGLTCYYKRNTASADVSVSLATMTLGTWASGGFKEVDSTNMPGLYEFGVPNAALASGADLVVFTFSGYTGMLALPVQVELTATNNQDGVRGGMTALPAAPMEIKKDQALSNFMFLMVSSTDHVTPKTGLTGFTAERSIDAGAFSLIGGSPPASVTEVGLGFYAINLAASDLNGTNITMVFTAAGADPCQVSLITQA
jgi:hypothetical protein